MPEEAKAQLQESIGKSARKGIAWTASAQVIKQILDFGVGVLMARLLSPADFGVVGACMIFFSFVSIFTSFGFSQAIVQRSEINVEYLSTAQTISVALGLFCTILVASCSGLIGEIFNNKDVAKVVPLMSLNFVLSSIGIVPTALLTRKIQFGKLTLSSIITSLTYGLVAVGMAFSGFGVWSLVIGPIASVLANVILLSVLASYLPKFSFNRTYMKEMLNFGGAVTASSLLNHVARNADNFFVGRYLGPEALGLYGRAYNLATIPKEMMVSVFGSVLFPSFARMQNDTKQLRSAYFKSINAIALAALPACAFLYVTSPELISSVYGPKWAGAVIPLRTLSFAGFVYTLYIPCATLLLGLGKVKTYTMLQIIYSIGIVLAVGLTIGQGINNVAVAVSLIITVSLMAYIFAVHKIFSFSASEYWQSLKVSILGTSLMILVMGIVRYSLYKLTMLDIIVLLAEAASAIVVYGLYLMLSKDEVCMEVKSLIQSKLGLLPKVCAE